VFQRRSRFGFLERTIADLAEILDHAETAAQSSGNAGLVQQLDPRVKVCGALVLIVAAVSTTHLWMTGAVFLFSLLLIVLSHLSLRLYFKRTWLGVLFFTGLIALPAIVTTPGLVILQVPLLHWAVSKQGLTTAFRLLARAETAATITMLLILTTQWTHVLKSLRYFYLPLLVVTILSMTQRYLFLLLQLTKNLLDARSSRKVGQWSVSQQRELSASVLSVLMSRSLFLSEEVYLAMQSRGFTGEIHLLDDFSFRWRDWLSVVILITVIALLFLIS